MEVWMANCIASIMLWVANHISAGFRVPRSDPHQPAANHERPPRHAAAVAPRIAWGVELRMELPELEK